MRLATYSSTAGSNDASTSSSSSSTTSSSSSTTSRLAGSSSASANLAALAGIGSYPAGFGCFWRHVSQEKSTLTVLSQMGADLMALPHSLQCTTSYGKLVPSFSKRKKPVEYACSFLLHRCAQIIVAQKIDYAGLVCASSR